MKNDNLLHPIPSQKKSRWYLPFILLLSIIIVCVLYVYNIFTLLPPKMNFIFKMNGTDNIGMLGIQSKELNSQTLLQGILCVNHISDVAKVDLFMPEMGHGSSPPILSRINNIPASLDVDNSQKIEYGCFHISKMEMFMPGLWQVRVFYRMGTSGIFDVDLPN